MPVHGVASLLDGPHDRCVRDLWAELDRDFGVRRVARLIPWPHLSYQVAADYDFPRLDGRLRALAPSLPPPIAVRTTGLGIFPGPSPVLYLAVARTPQLDALHRAVWDAIGDAGTGYDPYYRPGADWVPHITLAQLDLTPESLGAIVARLAFRPLAWDVPLAELAVVRCPDDAPCKLCSRYTPGAPAAPTS